MNKKIKNIPSSLIRRFLQLYWQFSNSAIFHKNKISIGKEYKIKGIVYIQNKGTISIGSKFAGNSGSNNNPIGGDTILRIICYKNANIIIGNNCGISNSTLIANEKIVIEDNVLIGGGCRIWDSDFHPLNASNRFESLNKTSTKPILIKKNSFIGAGSIILKGVTIGERSIIGAGSVVTKRIPDDEIWGGNPARFLKKLNK